MPILHLALHPQRQTSEILLILQIIVVPLPPFLDIIHVTKNHSLFILNRLDLAEILGHLVSGLPYTNNHSFSLQCFQLLFQYPCFVCLLSLSSCFHDVSHACFASVLSVITSCTLSYQHNVPSSLWGLRPVDMANISYPLSISPDAALPIFPKHSALVFLHPKPSL